MEEKYITTKGEAKNHRNNVDLLDNTCNIDNSHENAMQSANEYLVNGARKVQIFKLINELEIREAVMIQEDGHEVKVIITDN